MRRSLGRLYALSGPSRSAISELEYIQMQSEHFPDPETGIDKLDTGDAVETGVSERRSFFYDWILLLAGLSFIYGIGYWFSP